MPLPKTCRDALARAKEYALQGDLQQMIFAYAEADFLVRDDDSARSGVFELYRGIARPAYQAAVQKEITSLERALQQGETKTALRTLSWITFYCRQAGLGAHFVQPTIDRLFCTYPLK